MLDENFPYYKNYCTICNETAYSFILQTSHICESCKINQDRNISKNIKELKRLIKKIVAKKSKPYLYKGSQYNLSHRRVYTAIKRGDILKSAECSACGANKNVVAHHDDYLKPLEIRWLCSKCHFLWHKKNGNGLNK